MTGAIIGDVVGSVYEFAPIKTRNFPLFQKASRFTDDTVLTLAVAKALRLCPPRRVGVDAFKSKLVEVMHEFGALYPNAGFGYYFIQWLDRGLTQPYGSCGNGSAMRVSPIAWYADSLEEAEALAKASAEVTHNHPDGILGAQAVAAALWLARKRRNKALIRAYVESNFYLLDFTLEEIRPAYEHVETCQESIPQAIQCFLEADSFEAAIRNTVYLGGDCDTTGAIAGSIAEAYYGVDKTMEQAALSYLDGFLLDEVKAWQVFLKTQ